jgi:multiple sugar transport system substrate-binding protein
MTTMSRLCLSVIFFVIMLLFTGSITAQENEPVTLRFSWWGSETRHERTNQVIELFQAQYPWITIEGEPMIFDDYWNAVNAQGEAGHLPDLMQQDYSRLNQWVDNGWLLPMEDFVADGIIDLANVSDANISSGRVSDGLYAISMGTNSFGLVIDTDAFEAAGIPLPEQDWTWTDFEDVCIQLHEKLDQWCIGGNLGNDNGWISLWLAYGKLAYTPDGTALGYDDDQPLVDFLNMMLRLQSAGAIPNRATQIGLESGTAEDEPIIKGDAVMANLWSNQLVALWNTAGEDRHFVMYHMPRPADGCCSENYVKPSQFLSISANSEHPEEAAMFINFFTNSLEANRILLAERGVPISSVVQEDLADYVSPAQAETFEFLRLVEDDSSPLPPPDAALHGTIRDTLYVPILRDAVMFEEISPEEAVALFREEANALLGGQ